MNREQKQQVEHLTKLLSFEFPDMHPYSIALKIQAQTGIEVAGRYVKALLQENLKFDPTSPNHEQ